MVAVSNVPNQASQISQAQTDKADKSSTTSIPYNGSGTINIHVNNPTASLGGYMPYCYPPAYYIGYPQGVNQIVNVNSDGKPTSVVNHHPGSAGADATAKASADANNVKDKKEREIVVLTDNYIKTLENYLKSNNKELRRNAIKEVLMRFKEDKSRLENPSLTALLNIALQDSDSEVQTLAMTILQTGYAKGDKLTEQLLKKIQNTKDNFSQSAVQATDGLLQMAKTKTIVPDNSHYKDQPSTKKKG